MNTCAKLFGLMPSINVFQWNLCTDSNKQQSDSVCLFVSVDVVIIRKFFITVMFCYEIIFSVIYTFS